MRGTYRRRTFHLIYAGAACLYWLAPLGLAGMMLQRYGYYDDVAWLTGIPLVMIAFALALAAAPRPVKRGRFMPVLIALWLAVTLGASVYWAVIWMRGAQSWTLVG